MDNKQEMDRVLHEDALAKEAIDFLEGVIAETRRVREEAGKNWEGATAEAVVQPLLEMLDKEASSASTWLEQVKRGTRETYGIYTGGFGLGKECNRRATDLNRNIQVILAIGKVADLVRPK